MVKLLSGALHLYPAMQANGGLFQESLKDWANPALSCRCKVDNHKVNPEEALRGLIPMNDLKKSALQQRTAVVQKTKWS